MLLFQSSTNAFVASTTSDSGGNYSFTVSDNATQYWLVTYNNGPPFIAGTSRRDLVGE